MLRLHLLLLALLVGCAPPRGVDPEAPPAEDAWLATVSGRIAASEYALAPGSRATNRAHGFTMEFDDAAEVTRRDGRSVRFGTAAIDGVPFLPGAAQAGPCRSDGALDVSGDCLRRLVFGDADATEWFENGPEGLRQGWQIGAGGAELSIDVAVDQPVTAHGGDLRFGDAFAYAGLLAWDAAGAALDARMEPTDEGLRIAVEVGDAPYPVTVDPLLTAIDWIFVSSQSGADVAESVASAGDVNRDGYADVLVGAPDWVGSYDDQGRAWLFLGGPSGLALTPVWDAIGADEDEQFGNQVAGVGDVNNDNYADFAVSSPYWESGGRPWGKVTLYAGSASGTPTVLRTWTGGADWRQFGERIAGAGDVNGDGYSDVAVTAYGDDTVATNAGSARVYLGSENGLLSNHAWLVYGTAAYQNLGIGIGGAGDVNGDGFADLLLGVTDTTDGGEARLYRGSPASPSSSALFSVEGVQSTAALGTSVASAGDVDGDGDEEILIGAPGFTHGHAGEGRAFVFSGTPDGPAAVSSWTGEADEIGAAFGTAVAGVGDINGDGYEDIAVGAPLFGAGDAGRVWVFPGSASGIGAISPTMLNGAAGSHFGAALSTAGDVNADGFADLIVGAPALSGVGAAYVYEGSADGVVDLADWASLGFNAGETYGAAVGGGGDVDGDGFGDVVIGAPLYDAASSVDAGRAVVFEGSVTGLGLTAAWTETGPTGSELGAAVAIDGDGNGDGYADLAVGLPGPDANDFGTVQVFAGSGSGLGASPADSLQLQDAGDRFGAALSWIGDLSADGYADLAVGAPLGGRSFDADNGAGAVQLFLGSSSWMGSAVWGHFGEQVGAEVGASVAGADTNGDGYSDVIVGSPGYDGGAADEGLAQVFLGASGDGTLPLGGGNTRSLHSDASRLATWSRADDVDTIDVSLLLRSPYGRTNTNLQVQVAPLGSTFANGQFFETSFADIGVAGLELSESLNTLAADTAYHWRARRTFDRTDAPEQTVSPWIWGGRGGEALGVHSRTGCTADQDADGLCDGTDPDQDGDGYTVPTDCDDTNADVHPGADEVVDDGIDQDCNGFDTVTCWTDGDGDGYGTTPTVLNALGSCAGYADGPGDCNDANAAVNPGASEICDGLDDDCDGSIPASETDDDGDGDNECADGDCDDANVVIYLGAPELCDGLDNNCDGVVPLGEIDNDGDGDNECADGDCNDANAAIYLGAPELCDGLDNDCNGAVPANETDGDGDGQRVCAGDCDDSRPSIYLGAPELCDGRDNDCDGALGAAEVDGDGDLYFVCVYVLSGGNPAYGGSDCDDAEPDANPGEPEVCDGIDNDCDGEVDENLDLDGDGWTTCNGDCNDASAAVYPGAPEVCDARDNDCDGAVPADEQDPDGDGYIACCPTVGLLPDGVSGGCDCGSADPATHPSAEETCDRVDNDCDGSVPGDELDGDGDGFTACEGDCDDAAATTFPGAPELCNGVDDDCNGQVPSAEADDDGDGVRVCADDCNDGNAAVFPGAPEACDGLDDDCDGVVPADEIDNDGDGFDECADGDCDDANPTVFVGASELCDDLDNDCDGLIPTQETDDDGDGFDECEGLDCDDADPDRSPGEPEVCDGADQDCDFVADNGFDLDDDGYYGGAGCAAFYADLTDCDDTDDNVFPYQGEQCDGRDDDCDGAIDEDFDLDLDGFLALSCPGGDDCDDEDAAAHPGAAEVCDGADNDCDGAVDEDFDADGDGFFDGADPGCASSWLSPDCDDTNEDIHPGQPELCDGIDGNCDGVIPVNEQDNDGDGFVECADPSHLPGGDCDDGDASIAPGEAELCNGVDEDCDGSTDEDFDADEDGWFDGSNPGCAATYVGATDCDDADAAIAPLTEEICDGIDQDCDLEIDEEFDEDGDGVTTCAGDCNDDEAAIYPGAGEICGNGIDDDCDGLTDVDQDSDGDGVTTCGGDCDDADAAVFPGAPEDCDGLDDDCDLAIDEDFDGDGDGWFDPSNADCIATYPLLDCDDADAAVGPGAAELCDGLDQDCDGAIDEDFDLDGDGFVTADDDGCVANFTDLDCDDGAPDVNPDGVELCNAVDDDCDGLVDEDFDADGDGAFDAANTACAAFYGSAADCDDANADTAPGAVELCDGLDNDCEGSVPNTELDADADGYVGCASPTADHVAAPLGGGDCDDADDTVFPDAVERCDSIDQDCDGEVDEDFDGDADGFADALEPECEALATDPLDCDDSDDAVNPAALEACNFADDDCDGAIDEDFDLDGDGVSSCGGDCDDADPGAFPGNFEDCGNGVDDNCDGNIDEDVDLDGDGVTTCGGDCNDGDAGVFTGAVELCDGLDQDCDFVADEDFDADADGWADADDPACAALPELDCDDDDPAVHPGVLELCNAIDDDCDGAVDELFDLDGDGVFDAFTGDCIATYGLFNTDCDDFDEAVYPGADELCDGVDQDCDGEIDEGDVCGDDDDSVDDDDSSSDDDDSSSDDDDATSDDDDATSDDDDSGSDDDDATVGDDDDSAPVPYFYPGCVSDCGQVGRGGGLLALLLPLLAARRRRTSGWTGRHGRAGVSSRPDARRAGPTLRCLGAALVLLLIPASASAQASRYALVVVTPDAATAEKWLQGQLPQSTPAFFQQPTGDQVLGGVWLLGATPEFSCPDSSLPAATVSEALDRAQRRLDELEVGIARSDLAQVRQTVACLEAPVVPEELWKLHFLEGVANFYSDGAPAAMAALGRAVAVLPSQPYDESYPPALREVYLKLQQSALNGGRVPVAAAGAQEDQPGAVWLDGQRSTGTLLDVVPGEHVLQVRDASGKMRGALVKLAPDSTLLVVESRNAAGVPYLLDAGQQKTLASWTASWAKRNGARVWLHDGKRGVARLGEMADSSNSVVSARAVEHPILTVSAGGGYQWTGGGSYAVFGGEVTLRLHKFLRIGVRARPSVSQPVLDPVTGDSLGRMVLVPATLGARLRFVTPFVQVIGLDFQIAWSPNATEGPPVLAGVLGSYGVEIPFGESPVFVRPQVELGNLGPFFAIRGVAEVGFTL